MNAHNILLRLSYCTIGEFIEKCAGSVTASDIERLIRDEEIQPSILMNGQYLAILNDLDEETPINLAAEDMLFLSAYPNETYIQEVDIFNDVPENYKNIERARQGAIVQGYGLWRVENQISKNMAILIPPTEEFSIKCLTSEYDELTIVLENSEIRKLLSLLTTEVTLEPYPVSDISHLTHSEADRAFFELTDKQKQIVLDLASNPDRIKKEEYRMIGTGIVCKLLSETSARFSYGGKPSFEQIVKKGEQSAAAAGIPRDGLSNLRKELTACFRFMLDQKQ